MGYRIRTMLLETQASSRRNGRATEKVLEELEIDTPTQEEGVSVMEGIAGYLENEGFDIEEADDDE